MKARFFYAPPIFSNAPKLSVLTENQILYSEQSDYGTIQISRSVVGDFDSFDPTTQENDDYPIMLEISYEEACEMPLNGQANWIKRYSIDNQINTQIALQA